MTDGWGQIHPIPIYSEEDLGAFEALGVSDFSGVGGGNYMTFIPPDVFVYVGFMITFSRLLLENCPIGGMF